MSFKPAYDQVDWPIAKFPSTQLREEFLEEVRIWNKHEGLPTILALPLEDGTRVRFWSGDSRQRIIVRLIETYGGLVQSPPPSQRSTDLHVA